MHMYPLLLLGVGQLGLAIARQAVSGQKVTGTTRNPNRLFEFLDAGINPIIMPLPAHEIIAPLAENACVVASFPPDGETDSILAPACCRAKSIVYISTTGVYGKRTGTIDNTTTVDRDDERAKLRLKAEEIWQQHKAIVVRAPGIYGPTSGLHLRLSEGSYHLPGSGTNMISRIHVEDLASIVLLILDKEKMDSNTYVIGDWQPCTQLEIVTWLCQQMNLPLPDSVPISEVSPTLRGDRSVNPTSLLKELGYTLKYPTYHEGYTACLKQVRENSTA